MGGWTAVHGTAWSASILSGGVVGPDTWLCIWSSDATMVLASPSITISLTYAKKLQGSSGGYLGADTVGNSCGRGHCRAASPP